MPAALQNPFLIWLLLTAILAGLTYAFVRPELRTRAVAFGSLILASVVSFWPPYARDGQPGKIHLGLDLRGGIHLVLQVVTDDALNATVDDAVQTARTRVADRGINVTGARRVDPTKFALEGVDPVRAKDVRDILRDYFRTGWDIKEAAGGFEVAMTDSEIRRVKEQTVEEAIKTLERRVNQLGVAEPVIAKHGQTGDQILVQLPGVSDVEAAKRIIKTTAQLQLKLVEDAGPNKEALLQAFQGKLPEGLEIAEGQGDTPGQPTYYVVKREAVITGRDLKNARVSVDETNRPAVSFTLNPTGADKFGRATAANIGKRLAIILDGAVSSAPSINSRITSDGQITGSFTTQEADELSKVLRAGALPATLKYLQQLNVGASLGRDSVRSGVIASIMGMAFLATFMLLYYKLSGVNAIVALAANLAILLGVMAYTGATLTLPGIAGIILTIGVGVDTNVLIFERIREELRNGKTVKAAIANGFDRVWLTIIDTHVTALIAAAFLFQFGTGPIKGFAVTLVMGLLANIFASYFVSRFLFDWFIGKRQVASLSI